jgi:glutamyl-tRNA synthetase
VPAVDAARTRPRSRLAPSPTGPLHVGNAATFLVNWALARNLGWELVLRIEDLDAERTRAAGDVGAEADLAWLGIDHDGPAIRQSERMPAYVDAMARLAAQGLVYRSPMSRAEVREATLALGAPHADDGHRPFPTALRPRPGPDWAFTDPLTNHRLRTDPGEEVVDDRVAGVHRIDPSQTEGDCIVWTKAGVPAYQLAVTVDDALQGITDVVRGDDLLPSAAIQARIHRALGARPPAWWHLPLVVDRGGARLAKRHGSASLRGLRESGADPGRVRGLVRWWITGEREARPCTPDEFRNAIDAPILREWHRRTRSAPSALCDRAFGWLQGSAPAPARPS